MNEWGVEVGRGKLEVGSMEIEVNSEQ